jgi:hypothetical protein
VPATIILAPFPSFAIRSAILTCAAEKSPKTNIATTDIVLGISVNNDCLFGNVKKDARSFTSVTRLLFLEVA